MGIVTASGLQTGRSNRQGKESGSFLKKRTKGFFNLVSLPFQSRVSMTNSCLVLFFKNERTCLLAAVLLLSPRPACADVLWCSVTDAARHRAFVSDPLPRPAATKYQLWRYASRFVDAVNGRYAAGLAHDDGACRMAGSLAAAATQRAELTSVLRRQGQALILVGVF